MPPKPKFSKDQIIQAAYELMEEKGIDAVVAREVGKKLGATTAPIFTYFKGMEELKEEVYLLAMQHCNDYLKESVLYFPPFKEFGMRWIRYAKDHPYAYELLFMTKNEKMNLYGFINEDFKEILDYMKQEQQMDFHLTDEEADALMRDMSIYAQGIASICRSQPNLFGEEKTSIDLGRMFIRCISSCENPQNKDNLDEIKKGFFKDKKMPVKKN